MVNDPMRVLIKAANERRRVAIVYRKSVARSDRMERVVEPYQLSQGKQDILVRCYQITPKEGWRFFMTHKIESARATQESFEPRRRITMPSAEVHQTYDESEWWTEARQQYRDLVCDVLADGTVDADEIREVTGMMGLLGLNVDDIKYVHASLYHRCLGQILDDGFVSSSEVEEIRFLHRVFKRFGWCVGD